MSLIIVFLLICLYLKTETDKKEIKKEIKRNGEVIQELMIGHKIDLSNKLIDIECAVENVSEDVDLKIEREIYKLAFTPIHFKKTPTNREGKNE